MASNLGDIIDSLRETPKIEKWEYKIATWLPSDGSFESWLDANGTLGWELVQITNKITNADITCIFKRKIQ